MMARDCIKSKASLKSEGRTGNRGPAELGMADSARLCSPDVDLKSSELASRGEFGYAMTRRSCLIPGSPNIQLLLGLGETRRWLGCWGVNELVGVLTMGRCWCRVR